MGIIFKKLTESELDTIIEMRINQLTEEYTSEGKKVPEDVDLRSSLREFYTKNMAAGTYVSWLAMDGEKIVGTSGMSFAEKPPYFTCTTGKLGILSSMYTDPDYRRMGIATQLLDRVVNILLHQIWVLSFMNHMDLNIMVTSCSITSNEI